MAGDSKLSRYATKRDFTKTKEPQGASAVRPSDRLRFVVQKHDARRLHYDLRLELDGVFKSWAVTRGPSLNPADKRLAVEVEDHPLDYGDFEGTIPEGQYGGGTVQLWDRGYWAPEGGHSPEEAFASGDLKFTLDGKKLHGSWVLVRMKHDRAGGKRTNWLLIKHSDAAAADDGEALLAQDASVASQRSMAEIAAGTGRVPKPFMKVAAAKQMSRDAVWDSRTGLAAEKRAARPAAARKAAAAAMPAFVLPQLCQLTDRPPSGSGWVHEIKFDGYRLQMRIEGGQGKFLTRKGLDWNRALRHAGDHLEAPARTGSTMARSSSSTRQGAPDFMALQPRSPTARATIWCFSPSTFCSSRARTCVASRSPRARRALRRSWRSGRAGTAVCVSSNISTPAAMPCCNRPVVSTSKASSPSVSTRPIRPGARQAGRKPSAAAATRSCSVVGPRRTDVSARCWPACGAAIISSMSGASAPATARPSSDG